MAAVLVHEWLTNMAGSEKVVDALRGMFPGSPVCTTMCWQPAFPSWEPVRTTALQRLARGPASHIPALPAMPAAWRATKLPAADLYVTSFHTFALHAPVPRSVPHVVYCHTPPRFIWGRDQLRRDGGSAKAALMTAAGTVLARGDRRRAAQPTVFVANSSAIAGRIRAAYGRDSHVVHPPVDVERFSSALGTPKGDYFLFFSRLVPYKRPDLAVEAFARLGWPLVVAGEGRAREELERTAPANISFVGRVDEDRLPSLVAGARALIFPGEEDFGLVPVEVMASGTPVIAYAAGGALDYVEEGVNGMLFDRQDVESLTGAIRAAADFPWDAARVSASVANFGAARFTRELEDVIAIARSG